MSQFIFSDKKRFILSLSLSHTHTHTHAHAHAHAHARTHIHTHLHICIFNFIFNFFGLYSKIKYVKYNYIYYLIKNNIHKFQPKN